MRFTWRPAVGGAAARIDAAVEDLDGTPPVTSLSVSVPVTELSPDRAAVAAVLAFGPWVAGSLAMDREISSLTAQRVHEYFRPLFVSAGPVRRGALPLPRGRRVLRTAGEGRGGSEAGAPADVVVALDLGLAGGLVSGGGLVVGSTAPVLATGSGTLAVLAAAVVCSELLDVGTLVLCGPGHEDHDLVTATRSLLECVSLGLTWTA